jgi:hypothetical protein
VLAANDLSAEALAAELVALRDFTPRPASVDLDGACRTASLLAGLLGAGAPRAHLAGSLGGALRESGAFRA